MKKSELKEIIKECVEEILIEAKDVSDGPEADGTVLGEAKDVSDGPDPELVNEDTELVLVDEGFEEIKNAIGNAIQNLIDKVQGASNKVTDGSEKSGLNSLLSSLKTLFNKSKNIKSEEDAEAVKKETETLKQKFEKLVAAIKERISKKKKEAENKGEEQTAEQLQESVYFELLEEGFFDKKAKCPITLDDKDINSASSFKSKTKQIIKFYEENDYTEKQIGKAIGGWYYAIIGCTFGTKGLEKYEPKMEYLAGLVNKYPAKKDAIVKDIEKTVVALEKKEELNDIQKAYLADIKKAQAKLK